MPRVCGVYKVNPSFNRFRIIKENVLSINNSVLNTCLIFFVICLWIATTTARLKYNGLVLGFDYNLFQPDGAYYMMRTLNWISGNPIENSKLVVDWYQTHNPAIPPIGVEGLLTQNNSTWAVVNPRPLYPFLSIPFVQLIGPNGMLVIPFLSLLALMVGTLLVSIKLDSRTWGLAIVVLIASSPTIIRWMTPNLTDSLLVILFGAIFYIVWLDNFHWKNVILLLTLIPLVSATRFCLPILIGIAVLHFLRSRKMLSALVFIESLICALPAMLADVDKPILPQAQSHDVTNLIIELPFSFIKIAFFEFAQLFVLDKVLLFAVFFCLGISLYYSRQLTSQLFLAVLIGAWILSGINGVVGVNFRYQLPLIPVMVMLFLHKFSGFKNISPSAYRG